MSTDNPSYFSISGGLTSPTNKTKFSLFKKKTLTTTEQEMFKSATINNRRQIRSLMRSVSTNSGDSNQELLVLGEPRASDIAPPSPFLNTHKKSKTSSNVEDDLVNFGANSENNGHCSEDEEVFLSEDSTKYYNLVAKSGRRHSIGTYLNHERERVSTGSSGSLRCKAEAVVHANAEGEIVRASSLSGRLSLTRRNRISGKSEYIIHLLSMVLFI